MLRYIICIPHNLSPRNCFANMPESIGCSLHRVFAFDVHCPDNAVLMDRRYINLLKKIFNLSNLINKLLRNTPFSFSKNGGDFCFFMENRVIQQLLGKLGKKNPVGMLWISPEEGAVPITNHMLDKVASNYSIFKKISPTP